MKIHQRLVAILTVAFILSGSFPMFTVKADQPPEETVIKQQNATANEDESADDASSSETATTPEDTTEVNTEAETDNPLPQETADETTFPVPDEPPMFNARIVYRFNDYVVIGTFTDFTPDIDCIDTLYSLDEVNWQTAVKGYWNLLNLGTDDEEKLYELQNQPCLYGAHEPLKSYKTGEIDRFYIKLRITKQNGLSYETQTAVIERGELQPIPDETTAMAYFSSSIKVIERNPYCQYGKYQLTVCADATAKDVSAFLPDTLPVEVQLIGKSNFFTTCVVDCPVTWKLLSIPPLSSGESITISDAAEEILVPKGTQLKTPLGTFELDQPLSLDSDYSTDEVRLVLNVIPEDGNPTGVLSEERNGLEIAFHLKPTGAESIQAYVLTEGESKWTELPGLSLLKEFNTPSSIAGSGYALVLRNDQEPYRSYLAATAAGESSTPFFVALKIEGGVYDGRQLILAWPDIYEQLPDLPKIGGVGGNEGNAGAGNNDDSTESGQRPNLPQEPDDSQQDQQQPPASNSNNSTDAFVSDHQKNNDIPEQLDTLLQEPEVSESGQRPNLPQTTRETSDTSSAETLKPANHEDDRMFEWFDGSVQSPLIVQAATDIKNEENAMSDAETTIRHSAEDNSCIPLLPVIASVLAVSCIAAAVCKLRGYNPLSRIAGKIRSMIC